MSVQNKSKSVIIVGAGFGGLSAASLLAKQGFSVTVIEKNALPGGRASLSKDKGFVFDMGPSWYLMPEVFDKFFAQFNKKTTDYYPLSRLDPSYRIFFGKDDFVDIVSDITKNKELFESLEAGAAKKFDTYLAQASEKYAITSEHFIYKNYDSLKSIFSPKLLMHGAKLNALRSFDSYVKSFFKNERIHKILEYPTVFLGGDPRNTPAMYSLLAHADYKQGVWYPQGGLHAVAKGMYDLAKSLGVQFNFNEPVTKILVENGRATGVLTAKKIYKADVILVNADYWHAESSLLDKQYVSYNESYWKKRVLGPSGFILYLGINKKIKGLEHHNLYFAKDWFAHFDSIFKNPSWPENPSYYICCPSKTDRSVAPAGSENLFVFVPVASGLSDDEQLRTLFADKIRAHISMLVGFDIDEHLVVQKIFSQKDFSSVYNAYKGTALGLAHTLMQSATFRPSMRSKKVKGLYYAGQYTHPGVGVPMTVIAAEIVSTIIQEDNLG